MRIYIALYLVGAGADLDRQNKKTEKSAARLLSKPKRAGGGNAKVWRIDVEMKVRTDLERLDFDVKTDARNWRSKDLEGPYIVTTVKDDAIKPEEGLSGELKKFTAHANGLIAPGAQGVEPCELVIIGHGANFCMSGLSGSRLAQLLMRWGFKPKNALINIVSCKAASEYKPVHIEQIASSDHVSWAKDFHRYLMLSGCKCVVKARCATVVVDKSGAKGTKFPQEETKKKQPNSTVYLVANSVQNDNGGKNKNNAEQDPNADANQLVQEVAFKNYESGKGLTDTVWISSVTGKAMPQSLTFVRTQAPG